jgi:hypothetical protein
MDKYFLCDQHIRHELYFTELDYGCVFLLLSEFLCAECQEIKEEEELVFEINPGNEQE